jgi:hypothetical protein
VESSASQKSATTASKSKATEANAKADKADEANGEKGDEPTWDDLAPKYEPGVTLNPGSPDVTIYPVETFDTGEGNDPVDPEDVRVDKDVDYEADELDDLEAEEVTSLQITSGTAGAILTINGTSYGFAGSAVNTLSRLLDRAVVAVHF